MAVSIREYDAKRILGGSGPGSLSMECVQVTPGKTLIDMVSENPWLKEMPLVVKPDVLLKRRGKNGLLLLNQSLAECDKFLAGHLDTEIEAEGLKGVLDTFIVEPFYEHKDELYVCINSKGLKDEIMFYNKGGMEVGDVDATASRMSICVDKNGSYDASDLTLEKVSKALFDPFKLDSVLCKVLYSFISKLYERYVKAHFLYLELNPIAVDVKSGKTYILDCAAKLDHAADFECEKVWPADIDFPSPFGRRLYPEEKYIRKLDAKTGASLKLTILNPMGRIWTMIAGGGASVIYTDTVCDLGYANELCNYGEYSGAPTEAITYEYSKTILSLVCKKGTEHPKGKILLIGGGIANFTSVSDTFKGIIRALREFSKPLHEFGVKIYVRRGGPNYRDGLKNIKEVGTELGLDTFVFGPETYITSIIPLSLCDSANEKSAMLENMELNDPANIIQPATPPGTQAKRDSCGKARNTSRHSFDPSATFYEDSPGAQSTNAPNDIHGSNESTPLGQEISRHQSTAQKADGDVIKNISASFLSKDTTCVVYGLQTRAVQEMLDFDHVCGRRVPSVSCLIYEFSQSHMRPFYFGNEQVFLPVYKTIQEVCDNHATCSVMINFASRRSAVPVIKSAMSCAQFKCITTIAEGIPERWVRGVNVEASERKDLVLIGPATVGGIRPGALRIGNTGGSLENIMNLKLYRPGSVGLVTKSGGMLNELNNILHQYTNGIYEGIAIGGDRYPSSSICDHVMRYEHTNEVKMIVVLGELGGLLEYEIMDMKKKGLITKPIIAWCTGTCSSYIKTEVSFGHSGAYVKSKMETAINKNKELRASGIFVPDSFHKLGEMIRDVYDKLVADGIVTRVSDAHVPRVPIDYAWAKKLGLIRKKKEFISTISDERGDELMYAGWPISKVVNNNMGVGGVICLLWFKRPLPDYCYEYIEKVLMLTADHGPAVCGAHNTIVTARAGKDLISSLISGLCTIGERFGGACDAAAQQFSKAHKSGWKPAEFVTRMKQENRLIMGIGHRVKSIHDPDSRVSILKSFCLKNFASTPLINFALEVEQVTTKKKDSLILNVDGLIGVSMVDMLNVTNCFTPEEAQDYVDMGCINGLFVLGRSIGFIAHYLDQKRLKQGLYRHDIDDIAYVLPTRK